MINSTNNSAQSHGGNSLEPEPFRWVLRIIFISIFLVGSILNFVVCSAIIRRKRMRSSNNIFTFNLAMSDLMIVVIYIPTQMAAFENDHNWPLGNFACQIVYLVIPVCLSASIATLLAITSDRYRAIAYPMKPKLSIRSVRWILLSIWLISLLVASPLVFVAGTISPAPGMVYCDEDWPEGPYSVIYWISIFVIQYILPLGIILVLAILITVKLRRNSLQMLEKTSKVVATAVRQRLRQSAKITNMLIALVVLYAVCMLPQHIVYLLLVYGDLWNYKYRVYIIRFANVFPMANSALNPIAYGLNKEFKAVFKNFFKCEFGKDTVEESQSEFSRGRRFRLAVYKHVDNEGNSVLEYGRRWKKKSTGSYKSAWGAGLLARRKNSENWNGQARTKDVRRTNSKTNGHINNNSCEHVTECLVNLMDKQENDSMLVKTEKPSPVSGDTAKLLPSPETNTTETVVDSCTEEKRISFKKTYEHCNSDTEMKQRLLNSQSSTESNMTQNDSTDQITCSTSQDDIPNSSMSLEWDPTIDGNSAKKLQPLVAVVKNNSCPEKAPEISGSYDPVKTFFNNKTKNIPKTKLTRLDKEIPDVVSSPSAAILQTRKFDRNMFVLLESVRETVV
ncbi:uncharacterized protein LOC110249194 [Exaiptasia diaphana]|uniref:G-protein coupled receptors family 1 profile domain-containing protein n=1 Tax=Exaiptasia diaphana TaxID=2652724 RepID=A0A913YS55_EXADI|nr:uncharacterized protein LOC110249194 [Exaiptasia diaphana]XP_020911436.1 uncharacterized protein LOC110249194 [Exaiptasia diaphana]XP_028518017.1 uncharacterized protein LOC110249194 [Exaiptasia diaphana]XP_028518018.1 uncharacterized protein LOC110249194 [Exaiptasia diaphana]XP_028518019.1 uncharacterized protein LOC110249194 [Exaiptasia diaphana]